MVKSMTGFGKADIQFENKTITLELKTLNSKLFDPYIKLPSLYREKELEIRNLLQEKVGRGKLECFLTIDGGEDKKVSLNRAVAKKYYEEIMELAKELDLKNEDKILGAILKMPEVLQAEKYSLVDEEWEALKSLVSNAVDRLDQFRISEGKNLEQDLNLRIHSILELRKKINPIAESRISAIKQKLEKAIQKLLPEGNVDMNRFEQEVIYYLEKIDINEELVRLLSHCEYFTETLQSPDANGKKLGFISQEIGREINTLGAKSYDAEMQKIVVEMKDELEKVKEQLLNVL